MMNQFSEDDQPLVHFLKQNHPTPPPAHQDLEDKIMAAVEQSPPQTFRTQFSPFHRLLTRRPFWISAAIATSLTLSWMGYRSMTSTQLTLAQEQELEAFIAENWNEAMGANADTDWFVLQATASY